MKKTSLIFIFLIITQISFAQKDFREGYIVTKENDTIQGLIDYRGDIRNSEKCVFKQNAESSDIEYLPADINAYLYA